MILPRLIKKKPTFNNKNHSLRIGKIQKIQIINLRIHRTKNQNIQIIKIIILI